MIIQTSSRGHVRRFCIQEAGNSVQIVSSFKSKTIMKRCFILFAMALAFVAFDVSEARTQFIPNQEEAPGHVDESLPDSLKAPALFLYGFYSAYLNITCYCDEQRDDFLKAVLSKKMWKMYKEKWDYDIILQANNISYLTIPTVKVVPLKDGWYEASYQWPFNDREVIKIPVKVVQGKDRFVIVNIRETAGPLLPEKP